MNAVVDEPKAFIFGEPFLDWPADLYIPPEALKIILSAFTGPLDLLVYLIRRQNIDILDIPIAQITDQYIHYIQLMQAMKLELAGDYLVMAAFLAEIKSRLLLPKPVSDGDDLAEDPRAALAQQLQQYMQFQAAAMYLGDRPCAGEDFYDVGGHYPEHWGTTPPELPVSQLLNAFADVLSRLRVRAPHETQVEPLSVNARMQQILTTLSAGVRSAFTKFFDVKQGRRGLVVTFIAILELFKQGLIGVEQETFQGEIMVVGK